jgi:cephalosporin hydroxylase
MPDAISFLNNCISQQRSVVGASSLANDPSREQYPVWEYLPYVNDPVFQKALSSILEKHAVTEVYTPNPPVWNLLSQLLPKTAPTVKLLGDQPVNEMLAGHRSSKRVANLLWMHRDFLAVDTTAKPRMTRAQFDAMVHHANTIPGMCDHQKMLALSEVFRESPGGDVVEIGSWWGKSAFILAYLAKTYNIGKLLCVDPWSNTHALQDVSMLDGMADVMSAEEAHQVFLTNLIPYSDGHINFLREPSVVAATQYRSSANVYSPAFGKTNYAGKIALLHIDGNHKEVEVNADLRAWGDLVVKGGWVVFDDYKWPYGNGPRMVADRFIAENANSIARAFFMGGAMFIQLSAQ